MFSLDKNEETATFLVAEDDKTLTTPKRDSETKSPCKAQGSKSPEKTTEFNLKETNSDEESDAS